MLINAVRIALKPGLLGFAEVDEIAGLRRQVLSSPSVGAAVKAYSLCKTLCWGEVTPLIIEGESYKLSPSARSISIR